LHYVTHLDKHPNKSLGVNINEGDHFTLSKVFVGGAAYQGVLLVYNSGAQVSASVAGHKLLVE